MGLSNGCFDLFYLPINRLFCFNIIWCLTLAVLVFKPVVVVFSVRLLVLRGHSFFHPHHNGQWPPIYIPDFIYYIFDLS